MIGVNGGGGEGGKGLQQRQWRASMAITNDVDDKVKLIYNIYIIYPLSIALFYS